MRKKNLVNWLILTVIGVFVIPLIINEAYKIGSGYTTLWSAADMLAFYGAVLSFAGTVTLGIVAAGQAKRANDLASRTLALEESRYLPVVDIGEIASDEELSADRLTSSLQVSLNHHNFFIDPDGALSEAEAPVLAFRLSNICSNYITSLRVCDVAKTTTFYNQTSIVTKIDNLEYNGGIRVLGQNESLLLLISGAYCDYPPSLTEQELLEQDYLNPAVELTMTFLLGSVKGKQYREKIQISYTCFPSSSILRCPCIFEKEILPIDEKPAKWE